MAVQACVKANMFDDDDDDDMPISFKRSSASSRQNQLNLEKKKISSQKQDGNLGKQVSGSSNGQNSIPQRAKTVPPVKTSHVKAPVSISVASPSSARASPSTARASPSSARASPSSVRASPSSAKAAPVKSPLSDSKRLSSLADQSKQSLKQNMSTVIKEEKHSIKPLDRPNSYSDEDSEDDNKPLSFRLPATLSKGKSNHTNQGASKPTPDSSSPLTLKISVKKESDDDSDDEVPLSSRFSMKSSAGVSASKSYTNDTKPFTSKLQQNGSSSRDDQRKPPTLLTKRPLDKVNSSSQSSAKKPKLSDASQLQKSKLSSIKSEPKAVKSELKAVKSEPKAIKSEPKADDDNIPIAQRMKKLNTPESRSLSVKQKPTKVVVSSFTKTSKQSKKIIKNSKYVKSTKMSPSSGEGQKWTTLVHNGVIFPPPYKSHGVKMLYKGKPVDLTPEQEEVATMFAVMKDTDYAQKETFLENFMNDWRKILGKNHVIQKFDDCDFSPIYEWHQSEKEKKKQMSTEEKKALKEEKLKQEEKYMWAIVDGVKEKVGNFRVEPPGLFRGRGEHPKMGKLKRRIRPSDITINIGKDAPIPECPIPGQSWKEVKHDNTVTWLAFWNDPINPKEFKYVFLAASSSLKGQSDKEKYEKARMLKNYIQGIRASYTKDFVSKDITKRQIAVATYLIDKLALRAGNEKDDDEADTVGCCTLKVENVKLIPPNKLEFDFLGKDSIRYNNVVEVELPVYKAIGQFQSGKKDGDDLFDMLDTSKLNAHLKELMPGLTAKVFRTYNASITLDEMLNRGTKSGDVAEKIVVYQHANKEVAIICNHQRSISKSHASQISRLNEKIDELKGIIDGLETDLARAKKGKPPLKDADGKQKKNLTPEALERKIAQTNAKIEKMERDKNTKEDLKTVALGTSKINYLDPRISVAWCKRHEVPIEKIFNKSLLAKFAWSMDVDPSFRF